LDNHHNVSELLPSPHAGMHIKWIQAAARPKYATAQALWTVSVGYRCLCCHCHLVLER